MAKVQEIGPYSAYAIAVKYGYKGTEEEWVKEQEANRKAAEAAASAAAESAKQAAASAEQAAGAAANVDDAKNSAVKAVKNEGTAQQSAVASAGTSAVQAVKDEGAAQTSALNDAAAAHETELEAIASHPPQPNTATGKWQVWNAETGAYQDTDALYQGGYYTASVSDDGTLTWQGSQPGMPAIPGANIKGPKGDKGDPGLGVPSPAQSDAGKVPTVKADGSAYELAGPYAPLSAAIRPTASGNPVSITDSVEWPLLGLKVYGKSTQNGTPSPENSVPIVSAGDVGRVVTTICGSNLLDLSQGKSGTGEGVTFTKNSDGSYQMVGTATGSTGNVWFLGNYAQTKAIFYLQPGTYYARDCALFNDKKSINGSGTMEKPFIVNETTPVSGVRNPRMSSGESYNKTIYPAIFVGETAQSWEPYKSQILTISTPNGLPGIPVNSGGNYTDADGQRRWVDIIDYSNEKKYQYINEVVVDGTNIKFTKGSGDDEMYWNLPRDSAPSGMNISGAQINKYFPGNTFAVNEAYDFIHTQSDLMSPYFGSVDALNAFCVQKNTEGNPLTIMYVRDTPIETPLSDEEIAAYRALHTYDGATVVSTAEDVAGLEVKYLADGEKYVERIVSQKASEAAAAHTMALLADGIREGVNGV